MFVGSLMPHVTCTSGLLSIGAILRALLNEENRNVRSSEASVLT